VGFLLAGVAYADEKDLDGNGERTFAVKSDVRIQIELVSGDIEIKAWHRDEVRVRIDDDDVDAIDIDAGRKRVEIGSSGRRRSAFDWLANGLDVDVELLVPTKSRIEARTTNGEIHVEGVEGTLDLNSANGAIEVRGGAEEARLETINGSIEFEGLESRVDARSVNGSIKLKGVAGDLYASAISGSIRVEGGLLERVEMKTLSGSIELKGRLAQRARVTIKSFSGSVRLELPSDTSARFDIQSFSGGIRNELVTTESRSDGSGGQSLEFSTAEGDARVSIESFSRGVEIRKND
jgi:DUF4097 and DUF4098 domain-containing protein YvlB